GSVRWATGRPLPLGTDDRSMLVRVDGQATSLGFWVAFAAIFALVAVMFRLTKPHGATLAIAFAAFGIVSIRLLLGVSALLDYPFVAEGHQIGLWLLPALPWLVVLAGEAAERHGGGVLRERLRIHGAYALAILVLALVIVPDS